MKYTFKKTGHYLVDDEGDKVYEFFFYFEDGEEFTFYLYDDPCAENEDAIQDKHQSEKKGNCHKGMSCEKQADYYKRSLGLEYH